MKTAPMTAPEREALVKRAKAQAADLRNCDALPRQHRDTQDEIDDAADILDEIAALIEALSAAPAVTVTEGWKLVPIEPTQEMLDACGNGECAKWAPGAWATMIAASPTTPQTGGNR